MQLEHKIRIAFLIRRLDRGGAERQLLALAKGLARRNFDVTILTCYSGGVFTSELPEDAAIRLVCLNKKSRWDVVGFVARLVRTVRRLQPQLVHGYMGGANELSLVAAHACGARCVWGLRSSDFRGVPHNSTDRWLFRLGALLSPLASRIIVNSHHGLAFHASQGYRRERLAVVPNGIDTDVFTILPSERARLRREWNVDGDILVGRPGRFDPYKDYPTFIKAAAILARSNPSLRFVCVGDGTDDQKLRRMASDEGLSDRIIWAGGRSDMPVVYNALDICVSSSVSEGFPNVIAEAMACGTPCVATDAGDSAHIIGPTGIIVPSSDPAVLAAGIARLLSSRHRYSRDDVRRHIVANFSLDRLVANVQSEFERVLIGPLAGTKALA